MRKDSENIIFNSFIQDSQIPFNRGFFSYHSIKLTCGTSEEAVWDFLLKEYMQRMIGELFLLTSTYTGTFQTIRDPLMASKHVEIQPPQSSLTVPKLHSLLSSCHLSIALSYSLKMACFQEHNMWDLSPMNLWQEKPFPLCRDLRRPFPGVRLPLRNRVFIYSTCCLAQG